MKIRKKILSAALAGACLVGQGLTGVGVYASDAPMEPVDEVPGTFVLDKINPEWNSVTVTWTDTGEDIDVPTRLVLAFVNMDYEMEDDWQKIAYPYYMSQVYDRYYTNQGAAKLVSGVTEEIKDAQMTGPSLNNNSKSILYYGLETMVEGNPNALRYVMGMADYRKCMTVYTSGIECIREENEYGVMVYQPYVNGEKVEVEWEKPEEPEPEPEPPVEPEPEEPTPTEPETPATPEEPSVPEGGAENSSTSERDNRWVDDGGWAGSSDPGNVYDWVGGDVMTASWTGDGGTVNEAPYYGYSGEVEVASNESGAAADNSTSGKNDSVPSKNSMVTEYPEVPELGGENVEEKNGNWMGWVIVPVLISGVGLLAWWMWPILTKKSKKE